MPSMFALRLRLPSAAEMIPVQPGPPRDARGASVTVFSSGSDDPSHAHHAACGTATSLVHLLAASARLYPRLPGLYYYRVLSHVHRRLRLAARRLRRDALHILQLPVAGDTCYRTCHRDKGPTGHGCPE
jgi:hypothetical protein